MTMCPTGNPILLHRTSSMSAVVYTYYFLSRLQVAHAWILFTKYKTCSLCHFGVYTSLMVPFEKFLNPPYIHIKCYVFDYCFFLRGNNVYSYLCPWIVVLNQQLPIQTHSQYRVLNFKIMNDCLIKDNVHLVRNNSNAHLKSPSSTQCYFIDFPRLWGMSSSIIRYLMNAKYNYLFGNKNECCINCRQNSKLWIHLLCIDVSCNTLSPFMSVETDTMPSSRKHSTHLNSR